MKKSMGYSLEVKERAGRMYTEHRSEHASDWAALLSIATKIGCSTQTLSGWVKQRQRDAGKREGPTSAEQERVRTLERENKELRRANEILKLASAFFAKALICQRRDRHLKS